LEGDGGRLLGGTFLGFDRKPFGKRKKTKDAANTKKIPFSVKRPDHDQKTFASNLRAGK